MAELIGSESKYAGQRSGAANSQATGAKTNSVFGSTVVAPPISGALQNIAPGSQEWINYQMAQRIEALRKQYGDMAARRGMLQSGEAEKEFADAVQKAQDEVAAEAGQYNAQKEATAAQYAHEDKMAKKAAKSQETAAMYSGLGSMAPTLLAGKWGSDTGGEPVYEKNDKGEVVRKLNQDGTQATTNKVKAPSLMSKGWDALTTHDAKGNLTGASALGAGMGGTGLGTTLSGSKNTLGSLGAGALATGLSSATGASPWATLAGSTLSSGLLSSKTLAKPFSKNNWWKTMLGGGALAFSGGLGSKFGLGNK